MKGICKNIQDKIALDGVQAIRNSSKLEEHIKECFDCFSVLDEMSAIDTEFAKLADVDVSDDVVERVLNAVSMPVVRTRKFALDFSVIRGVFSRPKVKILLGVGFVVLAMVCVGSMRVMMLLQLIEGNMGFLIMVISGLLAVVVAVKGKYRSAVGLVAVACSAFVLRSWTEVYFDFEPAGSGYHVTSPTESSSNMQYAMNDRLDTLPETNTPMPTAKPSSRRVYRSARAIEKKIIAKDEFGFDAKENAGKLSDALGTDDSRSGGSKSNRAINAARLGVEDGDGAFEVTVAGTLLSKLGLSDSLNDKSKKGPHALDVVGAYMGQDSRASEIGKNESESPKVAEKVASLEERRMPQGFLEKGGNNADPVKRDFNSALSPVDEIDLSHAELKDHEVDNTVPLSPRSNMSIGDGLARGQSSAAIGRRLESPSEGDAIEEVVGEYMVFESESTIKVANNKKHRRQVPQKSRHLKTFLDERASLDNLSFKEPTGYWLNTYIPGDPAVRKLQMHLLGKHRTLLEPFARGPLKLDDAARQTTQPFDAPKNSALAVYLHADRTSIQEKSRMLVQVGLKGTPRFSGSRPAMNVGIVLDLRGPIPPGFGANYRALVTAFREAKDIGDHFSLLVAGKPGAMIAAPDTFKHGVLSVAMDHLFGARKPFEGETLSLVEAVTKARQKVKGTDDPTAPLGSSEVIIVTAQALGALTGKLERIAHESAIDGVPVSVVGIGDLVQGDELDRIVLAGQGNRRTMSNPNEAKKLVERELSAASRVVARALRLRIRLKPGVQLIDVLSSYRLDKAGARRVRQAEKSIDRRMARSLGIDADRGDDEEGIQIVIPAFYAGDSHVILLDVIAKGPGPIADVTVRYKDLVYLRNGITRANLSLDNRSSSIQGPLELNVLKNLLAFKLSTTLKRAGDALFVANNPLAQQLLRTHYALLEGMHSEVAGLSRDLDLANDRAMLGEYLALLEHNATADETQRLYLADSLRYAGHMKVLPRQAEHSLDRREY